ncbi:MAG: CotH kinase family protein, partial [Prevotellaceae bacterium]|nr:CotH kinase family protein [Prevotellaceae bacterium]
PQVSVGIEGEVYYWRVDGQWLTDGDGNKIPLTGGKEVTILAPQLRISAATNEWEICTNGGCTDEDDWTSTGVKATGPQGDAVFAENGVDNTHPGYVEFTLADGETRIRVLRRNDQPRFLSFGFKASNNPLTLISDIAGTVEDSVIKVLIPHMVTVGKNLIPTFTIEGSAALIGDEPQQSGVSSVDFSSPVVYVVSNQAGDTKRYAVQVSSFTGLPMVFINTKDRAPIVSKSNYVDATIRIIESTPGSGGDFSGEVKIKGRGNSTWAMPKKPYKMKFDKKTSLLGEPQDKEWVLLANYADKTSLRNETTFFMGRLSLLEWTPRTHFVEVFLNEVYDGTYQLCEQIKIAEDRVNVTDEGYLLEVDQLGRMEAEDVYFQTERLLFNIKDPDVEKNSDRYHEIKNYVTNVENMLYSENFDPDTGYAKYVDIPSFVDWYLITEIVKNVDGIMKTSCYLNIAPNGKLKMGPLWDFDISLGNNNYDGEHPTGLYIATAPWFVQLLKDPVFVTRLKERFEYFKSRKNDILNNINSGAEYLKYSVIENNSRWQTLYIYTWPNYAIWGAYNNEVQYLKNWLDRRFEWLEQQRLFKK